MHSIFLASGLWFSMTPKFMRYLDLVKPVQPIAKISPVKTKKSSLFRQSLLRFLELFWMMLYFLRSIGFSCICIATFICRGMILFLTTLCLSMMRVLRFITLPLICKEGTRVIKNNNLCSKTRIR